MAVKNKDLEMDRLANELTRSFARWEFLYHHGGQDPFWPDGMNLDLVRNHILSYKQSMESLMKEETEELSLFGLSYPDIYYRETPPEVPRNYMANPEGIRKRAAEQLTLYESDPNFLYCLENYKKAFPKGETRATKAAGLSAGIICGLHYFRECVEADDLVSMRRIFYESYESKALRWAEGARKLKAFLETEHNPEDLTPIPSDFEEEDLEALEEPVPVKKPSLSEQITSAKARTGSSEKPANQREEQLSLF